MVLTSILSLLVLALAAPLVHRFAGRLSGWLLALVPAAWTAWYATLLPAVAAGEPLKPRPIEWVDQLGFALSFNVDGLSLLFVLLVLGVGSLVTVYAGGYLHGHPQLGRFFGFLFAFMASMLGLVVSDNLIAIFVFWELTSITSFLLIGFGHERESARAAALQALLVTGIGGLALLAGLILLGVATGSFELATIAASDVSIGDHPLYIPILVLVLLGCFTKSAQVPFHFWLPGAMEAPAPVSAYLHSSTMVKAGVFLLAKLNPVLGATPEWDWSLKLVGATTMVYAALLASRSTQFKRVLAYTTVSALGAMVMMLGILPREHAAAGSAAVMAFLLAHALYKGTLFMVAGGVEHATHVKDVEKLSGLVRIMPITFAAAGLASVSMIGLPPLFGYAGKELLKASFKQDWVWGDAMLASIVLTTAFTTTAALLVAFKPFFGKTNEPAAAAHESRPSLLLGPVVLAALGLAAGLAPRYFIDGLVASATRAVTGDDIAVSLGMAELVKFSWPTAVGVALGLVVYWFRSGWRRGTAFLGDGSPLAGPRVFKACLNGSLAGSGRVTRVLQNGSLTMYIRTCVAALLALGGLFAWGRVAPHELAIPPMSVEPFDVVLILLAVAGAIGTTLFRRRLAAVAGLGVVGLAIALVFVVFGAPDVAMTQFAIETLTVLIFVLVFYHLPQFKTYTSLPRRMFDWVLSGLFGAFMASLVLLSSSTPMAAPISDYFSEAAVPGAKGRNIVNVIIVDFRATDTFGELVVLALAGVGVATLLHLRRRRESDGTPPASTPHSNPKPNAASDPSGGPV